MDRWACCHGDDDRLPLLVRAGLSVGRGRDIGHICIGHARIVSLSGIKAAA